SASIALADGPRYASYGQFYFVLRHGLFILVGFIAALIAFTVPMRIWERFAVPLFLVCLLLLVIVLIPGVGREVNGARRWLPLGVDNFRPSELMKVAVVLFAAHYTFRKQQHMHNFLRGFLPMSCALSVVGSLLLLDPDLCVFMVIGAIAIGLLFIG